MAAFACAAALGAANSIRVTVAARAVHPGELVVLTVATPTNADSVRVRAFDRDQPAFRIGHQTWRALVGIDLDVAPAVYHVSIDAHSAAAVLHATQELDVGPHTFPTRTLNVDEAYVN